MFGLLLFTSDPADGTLCSGCFKLGRRPDPEIWVLLQDVGIPRLASRGLGSWKVCQGVNSSFDSSHACKRDICTQLQWTSLESKNLLAMHQADLFVRFVFFIPMPGLSSPGATRTRSVTNVAYIGPIPSAEI